MKMNKVLAAMAASVVAASAFCAMSVTSFAAERDVKYTDSGKSAGTSDDGKLLRANIVNEWAQPAVKDIATEDNDNPYTGYVKVTFEVSGIGTDSKVKSEGNATDKDLEAFLCGGIADKSRHMGEYENGKIPADEIVKINGDGEYTVEWKLAEPSATVQILYVQTNIPIFEYGGDLKDTSAKITIKSVKTDDGVEETTTTTEATTTTTGDSTTTSGSTTTTTSGTGTGTTTASKAGEASAKTGDAGAAVAVAALGLAAATAFAVRKKD